MRIGELAREVGVSNDAVRYYERIGLLPSEGRTDAGYREYGPASVRRLRFIRRARSMGFGLSEIGELLAFGETAGASASDVLRATRRRIEEHHRRIAELERLTDSLERFAEDCDGTGPAQDCPILAYFFADGEAQDAADASDNERKTEG